MKEFFKAVQLNEVLALKGQVQSLDTETVPLADSLHRILAGKVMSDVDIPGFPRSTMDGYAVKAASTFGASESNPAFLTIVGAIAMGAAPRFSIQAGQAARIATGGMLPDGADSVIMVEHTDGVGENAIEVFKSVAPGQNVIEKGEDLERQSIVLRPGRKIRPQELGLMAATGLQDVPVYQRPRVGIISTGDEVIPIEKVPNPGQIRDINSYSLAGLAYQFGAIPVNYKIVADSVDTLEASLQTALEATDMVLISGGSSVGARDLSVDAIMRLPEAEILVHGISISPGKPTILAKAGGKLLWGLPGHAVSAMVVFWAAVRPFLDRLAGKSEDDGSLIYLTARLTRNLASVQGRLDYVRVKLQEKDGGLWADPVLGKSGLIRTMVEADGLIAIDLNREGLEKGEEVRVIPFNL